MDEKEIAHERRERVLKTLNELSKIKDRNINTTMIAVLSGLDHNKALETLNILQKKNEVKSKKIGRGVYWEIIR